jgi:hypothetical protein
MYGGFKKYAWDRWFMGHWYRRNLRNWWLPVVVCYSGMNNNNFSWMFYNEII